MPEDASLDRFASRDRTADADARAAEDSPDGGDEADTGSETAPDDDTEIAPAVSTFDWSPAGGACSDCGETVERRWRADGQRGGDLVCADCKEW